MGRILFFVLLALAIYIAWRYLRIQRSDQARPPGQSQRSRGGTPEAMVRCDACGLNLPQSEALPAPDSQPPRWYCCDEHRRQGATRS